MSTLTRCLMQIYRRKSIFSFQLVKLKPSNEAHLDLEVLFVLIVVPVPGFIRDLFLDFLTD